MSTADGDTQLLILCGGMSGGELAVALEGLKEKSKSASSHKRRELYWEAYGKMISKTSSLDGAAFCFLVYRVTPEGDGGEVELIELTKRQRGLVGGSVDFLGHKIKPLGADGKPDTSSKSWCIAFSEEDAQTAWDDIVGGEPCISITADGVYVATRYKRVLCKGISGLPKTLKDVEALVSELAPDKPLRSISFAGNEPPSPNGYNVIVAGAAKFDKELPSTIGHVSSSSSGDVYDAFLQRKNGFLLGEAGKLFAQMVADVGKGLTPIISTGQKECIIAYKNALMRKVYVHESMKKFIDRARKDGSVELHVIKGDVEDTEFNKYGKLIFELFYRVDLSTFS